MRNVNEYWFLLFEVRLSTCIWIKSIKPIIARYQAAALAILTGNGGIDLLGGSVHVCLYRADVEGILRGVSKCLGLQMSQEIETITENVVFDNKFVTAFNNDVRFPSGVNGHYFRVKWKAPYGVAVIPIQNGKVILLEHFRYAELSSSIELPQGFGSFGGTPEEDAARELFEETGFEVTALRPLISTGKDMVNYVFVAEISPDTVPHPGHAEETESISKYHSIDVSEISATKIAEMGIFDALTIVGLLALVNPGR